MPGDQPHPLAVLVRNIIRGPGSIKRAMGSPTNSPRRSRSDIEMAQESTDHADSTSLPDLTQRRVDDVIDDFVRSVNGTFTDGSLEKCVRKSAAKWKEGS